MLKNLMASNKKNAILLRSNDRKKDYLVSEENLTNVCELINTFGMEAYRVLTKDKEDILSLKSLAVAMCDKNYECKSNFEIIEKLFPYGDAMKIHKIEMSKQPEPPISEEHMRIKRKAIRHHIREKLIANQTIKIEDVLKQFSDEPWITKAVITSQIRQVRSSLAYEGISVVRTSPGQYDVDKINYGKLLNQF